MTVKPLIITENYPPDRGGMAQSCDRIVRSLRGRGIELDVVHFTRRERGVRIEQQERGRLIRCEVADDESAHAINVLWTALSQHAAGISHVVAFGGFLPLLCAPSFAAWLGVPLVTLLRGNDFDTGIVSPRRGWMLRDALARSAAVGVVSRDQRHKVASLFPGTRVVFIPNGIDALEWSAHEFDRAQAARFRAERVPAGRRVIGLLGHLKQKKGASLFLDALEGSALKSSAHLLTVGEIEPQLASRLESSALSSSHVPFVDRLELVPWYCSCDWVAIPSLYDGMPNVALEAGALGVPVLGSTAGGLADVLRSGENALSFAAGDVHACTRALDAALAMPEHERVRLGDVLRADVLGQFGCEREAQSYARLFEQTSRAAGHTTQPAPLAPEEYAEN